MLDLKTRKAKYKSQDSGESESPDHRIKCVRMTIDLFTILLRKIDHKFCYLGFESSSK